MNLHRYLVTYNGPGRYGVGNNSYAAGDIFVLDERQAKKYIKTADILAGNLEYMGEVDATDGPFSTNAQNQLDGIPGFKSNITPVVAVDLALPDTAFDTATSLALVNFPIRRRMMLDKIVTKVGLWPSVGDGAGTLNLDNRVNLLFTKGDAGAVTAQITTHGWLDDNGTMTSLGLPDTGTVLDTMVAAQDAIYIGYSSKFAALYIDIVDASPNGNASVLSGAYWDGTTWTTFTDFTDMTVRLGATLAADGIITWYNEPSDWVKGGTATAAASALADTQYWIQLTISANLDADTEIERITIPDEKPLANIEMIAYNGRFDAVIQEDDTTLTDQTAAFASTTAAGLQNMLGGQWVAAEDALYFGAADIYGGIVMDIGTTPNAAAGANTAYAYWNGYEWVALTVVDGTLATATELAVDGLVSWVHPLNWKAATASEITLPATAPTTITTDSLYWIQVTCAGNPTANFDLGPNCMPAKGPQNIYEVNVPADCSLDAHEAINIHVGEIEAETDALTGATFSIIGADI